MIENNVDNVGGQMVPFCQENRLATRLLVSKLALCILQTPKMETLTNKEDPILSARELQLEIQWLRYSKTCLKRALKNI